MSVEFPATLGDAFPSKDRIESTRLKLEKAGVKYVFSSWIDLLGVPKTKPVPLSEFDALCLGKGPQFAVHSVSMVPELGPADPDQIPVPDLDSLEICPWDTRFAWLIADLFWEGEPYAVCPRLALKRQIKRAAEAGFRFFVGFEPEFFIMRHTPDGTAVKAFEDDPAPGTGFRPKRQPFGYDAEFALDAMPLLGELIDTFNGLGWGMKDVVCEGAYSQYELDFDFADALVMADRFTFMRVMLKEIAKRQGVFVTFMPKPTQGDWRSGAHINLSLQPIDTPGKNLLEGEDGGWSDTTRAILGGLIRHGGALTCIACPTVNSYKGLVGRVSGLEGGTITWAPTHITYGVNNRSAMFRLPQTRKAIENRAADMTLNPYLALTMTIAAALEGITANLDPGPAFNKSLYDVDPSEFQAAGVQPLPSTLFEAVRLFDEDPLAKEALGSTMHTLFSRYKHDEWLRFNMHITDWERQEYLRFF